MRVHVYTGGRRIHTPAVDAVRAPLAHQPSKMLVEHPAGAAFMPEVPLASFGRMGLLSQTSVPRGAVHPDACRSWARRPGCGTLAVWTSLSMKAWPY